MILSKKEIKKIREEPFFAFHDRTGKRRWAIAETGEGFISVENAIIHQWVGCSPYWLLKKPFWYRIKEYDD